MQVLGRGNFVFAESLFLNQREISGWGCLLSLPVCRPISAAAAAADPAAVASECRRHTVATCYDAIDPFEAVAVVAGGFHSLPDRRILLLRLRPGREDRLYHYLDRSGGGESSDDHPRLPPSVFYYRSPLCTDRKNVAVVVALYVENALLDWPNDDISSSVDASCLASLRAAAWTAVRDAGRASVAGADTLATRSNPYGRPCRCQQTPMWRRGSDS